MAGDEPTIRSTQSSPPTTSARPPSRAWPRLGVSSLDLQQFHVWTDAWADDERWQRAVSDLKSEGLIKAVGISVNRWEPANVLRALRTGLIDAVQVVYNIFDQAPEDELFPLCQERGVAIIARVPFDEGSLTGTMTVNDTLARRATGGTSTSRPRTCGTRSPAWTASRPTCRRAWSLPELALRFILHHPAVTTVIPGMRTAAPRGAEPGGRGRQALPRQPVRDATDGGTGGTGTTGDSVAGRVA